MIAATKNFLVIAISYPVFCRAATIALIVGVILALINHGDKLLTTGLSRGDIAKILLTFLVPYCVSTVSSVLAVRERQATARQDGA